MYFQVPRNERSTRVVSYFWVPREERHASFLAIAKSVKQAFWVPREERLAKQGYCIFGYLATSVSRTLIAMTKMEPVSPWDGMSPRQDQRRKRWPSELTREDQRGGWPSTWKLTINKVRCRDQNDLSPGLFAFCSLLCYCAIRRE